jgi:hypothetical protein
MRFACVPSGPSNRLAWGVALGCAILLMPAAGQTTQVQPETAPGIQPPSRVEVIAPKRKDSFNDRGTCPEKKQGGNPRLVSGYLVFDGATDGNRQVDPQLAVGGGYVLTGTNTGLIIYTKQGEFVQGASQACFNGGIDPKMFYDPHNKVFGFDLWYYWDKPQVKPINLSISETSDPRGAWNTYPIPSPNEVDGGGIGFSRKWIGYTFPGGDENTLVVRTAEAKAGKPATVFHFKGSLGQPVFSQDPVDDLYFFRIERGDFVISRITEGQDGTPVIMPAARKAHNLTNISSPPQAPQKGTAVKTASGDRNPKNVVLQGGFLWFSQTINDEGRAAVQWHQLTLDGTIVQTGLIRGSTTNYIQTSIAVNKSHDVLIGFQETHADMFISPRLAYRFADDPRGTVRDIVRLGEGLGATDGTSWGDYSGSVVDGDNLEDLWTIQSITSVQGKGLTVIARLPYRNARTNRSRAPTS